MANGHGGRRRGSGRKPRDWTHQALMRDIGTDPPVAPVDSTPRQFLLEIMWNEGLPLALRFRAAVHLLPFSHPRLLPVSPKDQADLAVTSDEPDDWGELLN